MCLTVWDPYGSSMGVAIWATRIHRTYGIAIWATHGSIIGVSICACPHWTHMGPIRACPYGQALLHPILSLTVWANPYTSHTGLGRMGPICACPYGKARIHPKLGPCVIAIWAHHGFFSGVPICPLWAAHIELSVGNPYGPIRACPYGLGRIGPSHMGPILACYLGPTWVYYGQPIWACPYAQARIHATLGPYGLAIWAQHGFFMGIPIWA